jgi:hypothetical protein
MRDISSCNIDIIYKTYRSHMDVGKEEHILPPLILIDTFFIFVKGNVQGNLCKRRHIICTKHAQ